MGQDWVGAGLCPGIPSPSDTPPWWSQSWSSHLCRGHCLSMVMLGFPQQWLVDAYTIKTPSPKLDSALWWGRDKGQGCFGSWVYSPSRTPQPCLCPGEGIILCLSLFGLAWPGLKSLVTGYHGQRPDCQASALGLNS